MFIFQEKQKLYYSLTIENGENIVIEIDNLINMASSPSLYFMTQVINVDRIKMTNYHLINWDKISIKIKKITNKAHLRSPHFHEVFSKEYTVILAKKTV